MYRKPSRKKELVRRTIVYILMATAVVGLMAVLMLMVLGYRVNFKTRSVQQTALIQYNSFPRGATVRVDGTHSGRTQTKNTVLPGQRQFAMQLAGYEVWQKTLTVEPSTVTWLDYVRLVPTKKTITPVATDALTGLTDARVSPDRRFILGVGRDKDGVPTLALLDFRNSQRPDGAQYPLSPDIVTGMDDERVTDHTFAIAEWSATSRTALIRHTYTMGESQRTEWLWVDRDDMRQAVNLTTLLNLSVRDIHLGEGKEVYILQDTGDIRRVSVDNGTLSRPLVSHAESFSVYQSNTLAYIGQYEGERVAGVWKRDWQQSTVIARTTQGEPQNFEIRVSNYFNKDTVVVSIGPKVVIYRGVLPSTEGAVPTFVQSQKTFTFNRPVEALQLSGNGRFVVAEDDKGFMSYDLERLSASQDIKKYHAGPVSWLDGYHVWQVNQANHLSMQEFDGVNEHQLMPMTAGYDALLTQDGRYIYTFVRGDDEMLELHRLSMTVQN